MLAAGAFNLRLLTPFQAGILFSLLVAFTLAMSLRKPWGGSPWRKYVALAIRLDLLALLTLLLAGLEYSRPVKDLSLIVLRDTSPSATRIDTAQSAAIDALLCSAARNKKPADRLGHLHFSSQPTVDTLPTATPAPLTHTLTPPTAATDPAAAINLALALLPPDTRGRLLLLWDGHSTTGDRAGLETALNSAASQGIPIDVIPLTYHLDRPVTLSPLILPPTLRQGQPTTAEVIIRCSTNCPPSFTARLQLLDNNTPLQSHQVLTLHPGTNHVKLPLPPLPPGIHKITATLDHTLIADTPALDTGNGTPSVLTIEGLTLVQGRPNLLFISPTPPPPSLVAALAATQFELTHLTPAQVPTTATALQPFDAILLGDVPFGPTGLSPAADQALAEYVSSLGGGVLLTGGPHALGAGNWQQSQLAALLPLSLEPPLDRKLPPGALILAIDASSSMAEPITSSRIGPSPTQITQLSLALESAQLALNTLTPSDYVGILAFTSNPTWIRPLALNTNPEETARLIRSIQADGSTDILKAVDAALSSLQPLSSTQVPIRHIVLLTDGKSPTSNLPELLKRLDQSSITLSTIAIGKDADHATLTALAQAGHGRHHAVTNPLCLPQLFTTEARLLRRNLIQEGSFTPTANVSTPSALVTGYVLTTPQTNPATTLLATVSDNTHNDPLLARRHAGAGQTAILTTDLGARWSSAWPAAKDYDRFLTTLLRSIARPPLSNAAEARLTPISSTHAKLSLDALTPEGRYATTLSVTATLLPPNSDDRPLTITLPQHSPGHYEATLPTPAAGPYLAILHYTDTTATTAHWTAATLTTTASAELTPIDTNLTACNDLAARTNGRLLSPYSSPATLFDTESLRPRRAQTSLTIPLLIAALATLLVDIALRRLDLSLYFSPRPATPPPPVPWALTPNPPSPILAQTAMPSSTQAATQAAAVAAPLSAFDRLSAAKKRALEKT